MIDRGLQSCGHDSMDLAQRGPEEGQSHKHREHDSGRDRGGPVHQVYAPINVVYHRLIHCHKSSISDEDHMSIFVVAYALDAIDSTPELT